MKRFAAIVAASVLFFITLGMLEERETFARNWFRPDSRGFTASDADRRAASEAVHAFRTLSAHWYATDGDARFGERLPALAPLIEELRGDIAYVRRNGRSEMPRLMRIEFLSSELPSESAAEVTTREYWVTEFHWLGGGESDATRSDLLYARYRLHREGARWIVDAWDPIEPPPPEVTR